MYIRSIAYTYIFDGYLGKRNMKEAITITLCFLSVVMLSGLGITYVFFELLFWIILFEDFEIDIDENEIL